MESMAHGRKDQILSYEDIDEKFIIVKPYGTEGAYPSGIAGTIIASDVGYGFPEADNQSRKYAHQNSSFQEHAAGHLIQQIRDNIQKLEEEAKK